MGRNPAPGSAGEGAGEATDGAEAVGPKVSIGMGWVATLEPRDSGAMVRLQSSERGTVNVDIVLTAEGPVIRASVGALEIMAATDVHVSCDRC